jgi:arylsulfatase A-like enzyme
MKKIKTLGLDENTIIMFSSDNGATFSAGVDTKFFNSVSGLPGLKMNLNEGGIRVPFIEKWPGKIQANNISDILSVQYDMMPTFAELTGKPIQHLDGMSLFPVLIGNETKQQKHDFLYFEYPENGGQIAVRIGKWKGVRKNIRKESMSPWELFDIENDPWEQHDVSQFHTDIIEKMKVIVKREHLHSHILEWDFIDPKTK